MTAYPPDGGVARHIADVVAGLDPEVWEIDLACLTDSAFGDLRELPNVRLHSLRGKHPGSSARDLFDLPLFHRLVGSADVVHAHSSKAGFLARLAAASRGRRRQTIFTPHAWSFWAGEGRAAHLYLALERRAAHWCRTIIAVAEGERDAGLAAGVGRVDQYRVIYNGIELSRYAASPTPEPGQIVIVGRLSRQKRIDVALRTFDALRVAWPEARLDIVGDGPLRNEVEALVATWGLEGSVRLLGARDDVPEVLTRATCLLLTSDWEGCPLAVIEAMAAGIPVVATAVGGVPELVVHGETGLLAEPGRPEALAAALAELIANRAKARALGAAGRERARTLFSRERMVRETTALYEEVAAP